MIGMPVRVSTTTTNNKEIQVEYKLILKNALYSLESYKYEGNMEDPTNYCLVEDFTDDEGEAEAFLQRMVKGKVFPVHIKDLVDDFFRA